MDSAATGVPFAFSHVEIHVTPGAALGAWAELESSAPCAIYQTRAWLVPWIETLGRKAGLAPRLVVARDGGNRAVALMPLGLCRQAGLTIASWLGGKDSNCNLPLLRRPGDWSEGEVRRLLEETARACRSDRIDLFVLPNQPVVWRGALNPFARLPHHSSPSAAYGTTLPHDPDQLFSAKLSKANRKKLRQKEAKLAEIGPVTHRVARTPDDQRAVIEVFLAQKTARLRDRNIVSDFESPEMRRFIEIASAPDHASIELHALYAGQRTVAVYGGGAHQGHWSGMFNSFDADEQIARSSPGDLLLMRVITTACAAGLTFFDLGIGEARYKSALCDEEIALVDTILPLSRKGHAYATVVRASQRLKRLVKRSPRALAIARGIRARMSRHP